MIDDLDEDSDATQSANYIWTLPEGHCYAVEYLDQGQWVRRLTFGTIQEMRELAFDLPGFQNGRYPQARVVSVSRYPPHPTHAVVQVINNPTKNKP